MNLKTGLVAMLFAVSALPASAAEYSCKGVFEKKISFDLKVGKTKVVLTTPHHVCTALLDRAYRPTARYAGYLRFQLQNVNTTGKPEWERCRDVSVEMLGEGNSFDSIKVSLDLQNGERSGASTFIYDFGDYHGELANEKVDCKLN